MARTSSGALGQQARARTKKSRRILGQPAPASVRRRYDVSLNSQGAEMRLPALPQVRIGWRLASFLMVGLLAFVLYTYWNSPMYTVETVQVQGLRRLTSGAVNTVLDVSGQQVFTLDTANMQQALLVAFPEFEHAAVHIELPNSVVVTVTERIPVLVWHQGGRTLLVDAEGMSFPLREGTVTGDYPVVEATGSPPMPTPLASEASDPSALAVVDPPLAVDTLGLQGLPASLSVYVAAVEAAAIHGTATPLLAPEMVEAVLTMAARAPENAILIYDPRQGLGWEDARGWEVVLGDGNDVEVKLLVYRAILDHLKEAGLRPSLISVAYVHAPYFRIKE